MNSFAFAIIKATHTAPHKGPPRVIPATDYSDWDEALKLRNHPAVKEAA